MKLLIVQQGTDFIFIGDNMKKYIFGNNALADILFEYLKKDGVEVEGFCLNKEYISNPEDKFFSIEELIEKEGNGIGIYLAIGYKKMNTIREKVFGWLKTKNVNILSYVHKTAVISEDVCIGEGNIILENVVVQPFVNIGNSNIFWEGCVISHHSNVGSFNYFSPSVAMAGRVSVSNNCFFGINSTIKNDVVIDDKALIGAGSYVSKNIYKSQVIVPSKSNVLSIKSDDIDLE